MTARKVDFRNLCFWYCLEEWGLNVEQNVRLNAATLGNSRYQVGQGPTSEEIMRHEK